MMNSWRPAKGMVLALALGSLLCLEGGLAPGPAWGIGDQDRLWMLAERAFADHLYTVSRRVLERFVKSYPDDPRFGDALLILGKSQLALGEFQPALENFRKAERLSPEEARFWQAESLFRLKRFGEARNLYDALLAANAASPLAPDAMYGLAWADLELKRPGAAVTEFRHVLSAWPDSPLAPSATFYLARTLVELKRPADAIALLEPFRGRYPTHALAPDAEYLLGWNRLAAGQTTEGLKALREFVAAHPRHDLAVTARRAIAQALIKQGKKPELLQEYQSLISQSPPTAEGLYDAGLIAQRLGRPKEVESAWRRLKSEFPKHPLTARASLELAQAAFQRGQFKDAVALARPAAASNDDAVRVEALLVTGESELKQRRFESALKAFRSAAAMDAVDPSLRVRALAGSGLAHEELGHSEEAARLYAEVAADSADKALKQWANERLAAVRAKAQPPAQQPKAERPKP